MEKNATIDRIRKLMNDLGMSQTAMAKDMTERGYPITQSAISHILATGKISIETLKFMSSIYNRPIDWLTGNEELISEVRKTAREEGPSVELLQQTNKALKEMLSIMRDHCQTLKENNEELRREAELLRTIVKKAHDDGSLGIQNSSGKKK